VKWAKTIRWSSIVIVILVVVLAGAVVFLKTSMFRQYLLRKVEEQASESIGGRVQIGSLDLELMPLTVRLRNIVLRGTEPTGDPPLLQVDDLTVGIHMRSLLRRKMNLTELSIQHPVVHVRVSPAGASNVPHGPPSQSHTNVFDLAIAHFALTHGEIVYNDKKTPLNVTLDDLRSEITFDSARTAYTGFISYANGRLAYAQYPALPHNARIQFTATPSKLSVESAILATGSSVVSLRGEISNFDNPTVVADYEIHLRPQDFAALLPSVKAEGDFHLAGTLQYANADGQPFIRSLATGGRLEGDGISAAVDGKRLAIRTIQANFELADGTLRASDFIVDALGGQVVANAEIRHLDAAPASHIRAELHNISLRDIQRSLATAGRDQVAIAGTLAGSTDASWTGNVQNIRVRSDLIVRGGVTNSRANSTMVPIDANIHAIYDGPSGVLTVHDSSVRAESLALTADGEVSKSSSLKIHGQADDLHRLLQIASSFGLNSSRTPEISGSATLDTSVHGSLKRPHISGQLNAVNLHVQGSEWKSAGLTFNASPSGVSLSEGSLVSANQGRASFAATIQLHNWRYDANNSIRGKLLAQKIALADVQRFANVQYPISGDLSTNVSLNGTQINPSGSGSLEITNALAYGEPVQTLTLKFNAAGGSVTSNLNVATSAGSATTTLTYIPRTRAYTVKLNAPALTLQKLHRLQSKQLKAEVSVSANGEGTLDNPQLTAVIHVAQLQVQQKSLGNLSADLQIADKTATLNLDSQLSQSSIHARAQVELTGDFQTDAAIDTSAIPLAALLTTLSNGAPEGFQGQTELHATLKGPLKDKTRIEAHVTIPTLTASYQQLQIGAASPIRADYMHSVITLQPAEIRGTDTTLRLQGNVPLAGSGAASLSAKGQINMQVLRIFAPDLRSSGAVSIDVHAAGSPKNPALQGQIRLQNVSMASSAAPLGVDKLNGVLNIDSNRLQISDVTAQVGSGQVSVGGAINYRPNLQFALLVQGKSIRLRYPQGLRSVLDSSLAFSGNRQASTLSGRVLIDSLSFTPDFDLSTFGDQFTASTATPAQPGLADTIKLNVSVQSKQNLSATSSQVSIEGGVNLNVTGTAADPVITGRTELTAGELFYRGNRYQLQRGVITFADPNQTNPDLNVSVATSVEQYNLTINLRGTLDRLTTSYSSDPPLSTTDIIHLIAFGNTTSESAANNASQSTDAMVASSAIGAGLTSGVQKLAGFSSLQIDPLLGGNNQNPSARIALQQRVTKNFLFTFSTDVSQPGEEIVQGDYQISKRWSVNVTRDQLGGVTVAGRLHTKF
jgi:translocation and assembly module TamB